MTDWDPEAFTRSLIADMREHGGRPSNGPLAGKPLAILTSIGAKTGAPRTAIVTYHKDGDRWAIAASKGGAPEHPLWLHNLEVHPDVTIEVDNQEIPVRAIVTEGSERDRLWNDHVAALPEFGAYPDKTDRVIPMVVLERVD
jgi:deazaflavin-dependent oxidoreductase (nitroreductase family)